MLVFDRIKFDQNTHFRLSFTIFTKKKEEQSIIINTLYIKITFSEKI